MSGRIYARREVLLYTMSAPCSADRDPSYLYNKSGTFDYFDIVSQIQTGRLTFDPHT